MSRRNLGDLPFPKATFNPALKSEREDGRVKFETVAEAAAEDDLRIQSLLKAAHKPGISQNGATDLASRIGNQVGNRGTLASAAFMRVVRIIVIGALWKLVRAMGSHNVLTFTIIPRSWEFPADQLDSVDPRILLERFRQKVIRAKKKSKGGWLFAAVHGEYEPTRGVYQLHLHGLANPIMITALDALRKKGDFKKVVIKRQSVHLRVRISRQPLTNLPDPLTYTLQSYWPSRQAFLRGEADQTRQRKKRRIKEPHHAEVLLWLDRWRLNDVTLLMGLRVTKKGLKITNSKTNTNSGTKS